MRFILISLLLLLSFQAFSQEPDPFDARIDSLMQFHQYNLVIIELSNKTELNPNHQKALAEAQLRSGRLFAALNSYEKLYQVDRNQLYLLKQAGIQEKLDEELEALKIYNQLNQIEPDNAYYWKLTARSAMKNQEYPMALAAYKNALDRQAEDLEVIDELATLLSNMGFPKAADSLLLEGLSIAPKAKFLKKSRLKVLYKLKDYKEIVSISEKLFQEGDSSLMIQKVAGIANYHQENYQTSIELLLTVVEVESKSDFLHYYLGLAYREAGNTRDATKMLEKAIDFGVTDNLGNYYTQLAVGYEEAGEIANAIKAYQAAYKESKNKILLYHLARNYDLFYKDKKVALTYYERYLDEKDTANEYLMNYSEHRIKELKAAVHFESDSF